VQAFEILLTSKRVEFVDTIGPMAQCIAAMFRLKRVSRSLEIIDDKSFIVLMEFMLLELEESEEQIPIDASVVAELYCESYAFRFQAA